jgi:uncharacterized protein YeaO (DUF488 family)
VKEVLNPRLSWLVQVQQGAPALAVSPVGQAAGFPPDGCLEGAAIEEVGSPVSGRPRRLSGPAAGQGVEAVVVAELRGANLKQVVDVRLHRVYEPDEGAPGKRVLVDRVWPRGIKKESLHLDRWLPELGPSRDLRRWFGHRPERWEEFRLGYRAELKQPEQRRHLEELLALASEGPLILLYGARDTTHNQAVVIREVLEELAE